ncbi:MAG: rod shape-determining protein MreC [Pseudomonadota bacterium]|nr:rod shape-determining protein MreC [Pseudomonadota bacterium]
MPPPANRRTGSSRRAQYNAFIGYVVGTIGALIGGALLVLHAGNTAILAKLRGVTADATAPAAEVTATSRAAGASLYDTLTGYFVAGAQNARLQREVALARVELVRAAAMADENRRLKAQLHLAASDAHPVANAWLIASTDNSTRRYAIISAGSSAGVRSGMPVIAPLGLIGRVLETGQKTARVLLITDSESVVPVRRATDGIPAFAIGRPDGLLQLRLISLGINPLKPGDAFVTSGSGGLYSPGTPIAVVMSLTHDGAIARVLASPASSELVTVQSIWNPVADPTLPPPTAVDPWGKPRK